MGGHASFEQCVVDRGARVEIRVERGLPQTDPPGDFSEVQCSYTVLGHDRQRGVEDLLAGLQALSFARSQGFGLGGRGHRSQYSFANNLLCVRHGIDTLET